ncbi:MAG: hypothetical protein H6Q70_1687 [Firmicutes bacterium]|nr:hypothetical protein [Bacillota bacterium]
MKELLNLLENIWAIPKKRKVSVLFLGVSIVLCVFILQRINVKQDPANVELEVSAPKDKNQNAMLQQVDDNKNKILKDPFAVPSSFREKEETPLEKSSKNIVKNQKAPSTVRANQLPIVRGLIGSGDRFIAILEYGEVSKRCLLNDSIGPYTVVGIDEKSVILNGPSGTIMLTVGR